MISSLEKEFRKTKYCKEESLLHFFESVSNQFAKWRYSYNYKELEINLNKLSDILNKFEKYSRSEFLSVSSIVALKTFKSQHNEHSMIVENPDNIKSDFFNQY